jgi:hypothetical protein
VSKPQLAQVIAATAPAAPAPTTKILSPRVISPCSNALIPAHLIREKRNKFLVDPTGRELGFGTNGRKHVGPVSDLSKVLHRWHGYEVFCEIFIAGKKTVLYQKRKLFTWTLFPPKALPLPFSTTWQVGGERRRISRGVERKGERCKKLTKRESETVASWRFFSAQAPRGSLQTDAQRQSALPCGLDDVNETVPSPNSLKSSQTAPRIGPMTASVATFVLRADRRWILGLGT